MIEEKIERLLEEINFPANHVLGKENPTNNPNFLTRASNPFSGKQTPRNEIARMFRDLRSVRDNSTHPGKRAVWNKHIQELRRGMKFLQHPKDTKTMRNENLRTQLGSIVDRY
jgi:hypothetical protein